MFEWSPVKYFKVNCYTAHNRDATNLMASANTDPELQNDWPSFELFQDPDEWPCVQRSKICLDMWNAMFCLMTTCYKRRKRLGRFE